MNTTLDIYLDPEVKTRTIRSLVSFSCEMFYGAFIVDNLDTARVLLDSYNSKQIDIQEFKNEIRPFIFEKMIDNVRLIACFENIIKAGLIEKGVLIHKIEGELGKNQEKWPIGIQNGDKPILTGFTLTVSTLLKSNKYRKVYTMSDEIRDHLININKDRNEIHLYKESNIKLSQTNLDMIDKMKIEIDNLREKLKGGEQQNV